MKFVSAHRCRVRRSQLVKDEKLKKFWDDLADDWLTSDDRKFPNNVQSEKTSSQN